MGVNVTLLTLKDALSRKEKRESTHNLKSQIQTNSSLEWRQQISVSSSLGLGFRSDPSNQHGPNMLLLGFELQAQPLGRRKKEKKGEIREKKKKTLGSFFSVMGLGLWAVQILGCGLRPTANKEEKKGIRLGFEKKKQMI